jgi:hypothetical protein
MSALSPINSAARALFRFARRFFLKIFFFKNLRLEDLLRAEPPSIRKMGHVPILPSDFRHASEKRPAVAANQDALSQR